MLAVVIGDAKTFTSVLMWSWKRCGCHHLETKRRHVGLKEEGGSRDGNVSYCQIKLKMELCYLACTAYYRQ